MLAFSLDQIVKKTAKVLNLPPETVASVIMHQFKEMKRNQSEFFAVGFRLEDLGSFQMTKNKFYHGKNTLIDHIRRGNSVERNKKIQANLFAFRHELREYLKSREYKKRFGSWHWK